MKKVLISSFVLILLSVSLWAEEQSIEVSSFASDRIGSCIAIRYADAKSGKDLYGFFTVTKISSIKLLANKDGKHYIRISSEDETVDYIFAKNNRKNVLLALQALIANIYADRRSSSKDKLDLFIDR